MCQSARLLPVYFVHPHGYEHQTRCPILPFFPSGSVGVISTSINQRVWSVPNVILVGLLLDVGSGKSLIFPAVVIRPIFPAVVPVPPYWNSVNQRLPSGPLVMLPRMEWDNVNSRILPCGVITPILLGPLFVPISVNQRLPSGPAVILEGNVFAEGKGNSVILPDVVMRPMDGTPSCPISVNQRLPSGPAVMARGSPWAEPAWPLFWRRSCRVLMERK